MSNACDPLSLGLCRANSRGDVLVSLKTRIEVIYASEYLPRSLVLLGLKGKNPNGVKKQPENAVPFEEDVDLYRYKLRRQAMAPAQQQTIMNQIISLNQASEVTALKKNRENPQVQIDELDIQGLVLPDELPIEASRRNSTDETLNTEALGYLQSLIRTAQEPAAAFKVLMEKYNDFKRKSPSPKERRLMKPTLSTVTAPQDDAYLSQERRHELDGMSTEELVFVAKQLIQRGLPDLSRRSSLVEDDNEETVVMILNEDKMDVEPLVDALTLPEPIKRYIVPTDVSTAPNARGKKVTIETPKRTILTKKIVRRKTLITVTDETQFRASAMLTGSKPSLPQTADKKESDYKKKLMSFLDTIDDEFRQSRRAKEGDLAAEDVPERKLADPWREVKAKPAKSNEELENEKLPPPRPPTPPHLAQPQHELIREVLTYPWIVERDLYFMEKTWFGRWQHVSAIHKLRVEPTVDGITPVILEIFQRKETTVDVRMEIIKFMCNLMENDMFETKADDVVHCFCDHLVNAFSTRALPEDECNLRLALINSILMFGTDTEDVLVSFVLQLACPDMPIRECAVAALQVLGYDEAQLGVLDERVHDILDRAEKSASAAFTLQKLVRDWIANLLKYNRRGERQVADMDQLAASKRAIGRRMSKTNSRQSLHGDAGNNFLGKIQSTSGLVSGSGVARSGSSLSLLGDGTRSRRPSGTATDANGRLLPGGSITETRRLSLPGVFESTQPYATKAKMTLSGDLAGSRLIKEGSFATSLDKILERISRVGSASLSRERITLSGMMFSQDPIVIAQPPVIAEEPPVEFRGSDMLVPVAAEVTQVVTVSV